jgi:hypothetical protein
VGILDALPLILPVFSYGKSPFVAFWFLFFGAIASAVVDFTRNRWNRGFIKIVMLPILPFGLFLSCMSAPQVPIHDPFADELIIPTNIEVVEPSPQLKGDPGIAIDPFQKCLLDSLAVSGSNDPTVTAIVTSLASLA